MVMTYTSQRAILPHGLALPISHCFHTLLCLLEPQRITTCSVLLLRPRPQGLATGLEHHFTEYFMIERHTGSLCRQAGLP